MLPPPRFSISITSFKDGTSVGVGNGNPLANLTTCRPSCGAAVLVPVSRNTLPLLVPPARIPSSAQDSSQGSTLSGPTR
jgi:hypothetical protein